MVNALFVIYVVWFIYIILEWQETKQSPQLLTICSPWTALERNATTSPSESISLLYKSNSFHHLDQTMLPKASSHSLTTTAITLPQPSFSKDKRYSFPLLRSHSKKIPKLKKINSKPESPIPKTSPRMM